MRINSLLTIVLCAIFSSFAFCEPLSEPTSTKNRNLVTQTVPSAILSIKVPKEYQAKKA
jgi:hypothetical protein